MKNIPEQIKTKSKDINNNSIFSNKVTTLIIFFIISSILLINLFSDYWSDKINSSFKINLGIYFTYK